MRVVCRADASHHVGVGHVMRLLTLANALRAKGGDANFLMRAHPGHLAEFVESQGFETELLELNDDSSLGDSIEADAEATVEAVRHFNADWVVVDHYATDAKWESRIPCHVLAMEDMANRSHNCEILLNQNLSAEVRDFCTMAPECTCFLFGTKYALLRPEFAALRSKALKRRNGKEIRELLVTMGGTDQPNATGATLKRLSEIALPDNLHVNIAMGPTAPHLEEVREMADSLDVSTKVWPGNANLAELMVTADMAIGAAGSTAWERCALGLPTITVVLAENQRESALALERHGAAKVVDLENLDEFRTCFFEIAENEKLYRAMSDSAAEICDGLGTNRVIDRMYEYGGLA